MLWELKADVASKASLQAPSSRKRERLRVINIPSPPFQEVPKLQMMANWESALSNSYSLPEASTLLMSENNS